MPKQIATLLEPLQGEKFKCDEIIAQNIWRLLEIWEHLNFDVPNHGAAAAMRGEVYERKKEAAELTSKAFKLTFSEFSLKGAKEGAMHAALCEACGFKPFVRVSPEELNKGKAFFRAWYAEAEKYLTHPVV
ncbi:MAG: hypothetical protein AAB355_03510 [Patescibacteria group bacterium]